MLWLVGTGPMAREYAKVLRCLNHSFLVVAKDEVRAAQFALEYGQDWRSGGVESALSEVKSGKLTKPRKAIVAVPVDLLASIAEKLVPFCKSILLEKPGALEVEEIVRLSQLPEITSGSSMIYIGYNRRFLPSISQLKKEIHRYGPILSVIAEFDEPIQRVEAIQTKSQIKARWGFANGSHVLDLVWFLCGQSVKHVNFSEPSTSPKLDWHPSGSIFTGGGITKQGARYVYHGNYSSLGRWRLSFSLPKRRYILCPVESLELVDGESLASRILELPMPEFDHLKPGLYGQVSSFLSNDPDGILATIWYQKWHLSHLAEIFGYPHSH